MRGFAMLAVPEGETRWMRGVFVAPSMVDDGAAPVVAASTNAAPVSSAKWFDITAREDADLDPCLCCPDGAYSEYEVTLRERGAGRLGAHFKHVIRRGGDLVRLTSRALEACEEEAVLTASDPALRFKPNALKCDADALALVRRFIAAGELPVLFKDCAVVVGAMEIVRGSFRVLPPPPRRRSRPSPGPVGRGGDAESGGAGGEGSGRDAGGSAGGAKRLRVDGARASAPRYIRLANGWFRKAPAPEQV